MRPLGAQGPVSSAAPTVGMIPSVHPLAPRFPAQHFRPSRTPLPLSKRPTRPSGRHRPNCPPRPAQPATRAHPDGASRGVMSPALPGLRPGPPTRPCRRALGKHTRTGWCTRGATGAGEQGFQLPTNSHSPKLPLKGSFIPLCGQSGGGSPARSWDRVPGTCPSLGCTVPAPWEPGSVCFLGGKSS